MDIEHTLLILPAVKTTEDAKLPELSREGDACLDAFANEDVEVPGFDPEVGLGTAKVPLGFKVELIPGWEMQVRPRSGKAINDGITILNSPGTIDENYRGEVCALILNTRVKPYKIAKGDKICQLAIRPITPSKGRADLKVTWKEVKELNYIDISKKVGNGKEESEYNQEYQNAEKTYSEKIIKERDKNSEAISQVTHEVCVFYKIDEENGKLYTEWFYEEHNYRLKTHEYGYRIFEEDLEEIKKNNTVTYTSIANELQPTIATWYNALRRIALVGLLSVLVYLGIRIVLASSSPEGNSKYKKMLTDWLIALCLLFTLHYIMSATLLITQKLSSIFTLGTTDELLNTLRQEINSSRTWGVALSQVVMYVVLVIFTGVFTFQYLKRVLYMAFFTMIAPLITLTYPIDKVSDGKAQAFSMWIKEYIFNALIQVVHLIVYYTLVESAMELVKTFPLYGIIAIGFMTQAEKIIRSMFGFNNAETVGTMGAVAAGGLVTSAMNKLKSLPNGAKGGKTGGKPSSVGSSSGNVRTATKNPLSGAQGNGGASGSGETSQNTTSGNATQKRSISGGAKALIGKHYKQVGGTALGLLTGGAGAMIGFAAGVAQGDLGAALTGAAVGGAAGMNLGKGAVALPENIGKGVKSGWSNLKDTYREGAYGAEAAGAIKFDEEFRKGSTYKALQSNPKFSEESVQVMLDSGITDKKAMTAILDSKMDINEAIQGYQAAKNCPDEIYYSTEGLENFCNHLSSMPGKLNGKSINEIKSILGKFK